MVRIVILVRRQSFYVLVGVFRSLGMTLNTLSPSKVTVRDVLSVRRLGEIKRAALRRGLWFRALNRVERSVLELTVRCVDRIRSAMLAKVVMAVLIKLKLAMESAVERTVRVVGRSLALKVSGIALSWGNCSAAEWAEDSAFARYLAITQMNTHGLFQV
jgi:hypothetical protein